MSGVKASSQVRFDGLRDYVDFLDGRGLVKRIEGADWNLEIGALTELVAFSESPHCLLFDSIKGYPKGFRVVTNLYSSPRLQALALGLPEELSGVKLVELWRERIRSFKPIAPKIVSDGLISQNRMEGQDVDVLKFPAPFWHRHDGGRYIGTGDMVITRDPDEGWINLAPYRCMTHDKKTLGMLIAPTHHAALMMEKFWKRDLDAPVVVVLGQDPALYAAACAPMAWGKSELDYAGGLRGEPVEAILDDETGLPIPAHAEIALIGHVPPKKEESKLEGPFGECWGYYSGYGQERVVHVDRVLHRDDPILQGSPTMHGSAMMHSLGAHLATSAAIWDSVEREVPGVRGVYSLYQPCQIGSTLTVVSIKQAYPGHAKQAALAALASHACIVTNRMVIVVDEDVDPSDMDEVLFALTSRCNPADDAQIVTGIPSWSLDVALTESQRATGDYRSSTIVYDATRKPYSLRDKYPLVNRIDQSLKDEMMKKWGSKLFSAR